MSDHHKPESAGIHEHHESLRTGLVRPAKYIAGIAAIGVGAALTMKDVVDREAVRDLSMMGWGVSYIFLRRIKAVMGLKKEAGNNYKTGRNRSTVATWIFGLTCIAAFPSYGADKNETDHIAGSSTSTSTTVDTGCPIDVSQIGLEKGKGDRQDISELQLTLRGFGYYNEAIDGVQGPVTNDALAEFEVANGLDPTQPFSIETCVILFGTGAVPATQP